VEDGVAGIGSGSFRLVDHITWLAPAIRASSGRTGFGVCCAARADEWTEALDLISEHL
jgi:hypothetical protein